MILNFIVPGRSKQFSGGLKVIYEYALRMHARGHHVNLLHAPFCPPKPGLIARFKANLSYYVGFFYKQHWTPEKYHYFPKTIQLKWLKNIKPECLPHADVNIVSFWHTAHQLCQQSSINGKVLYLVQEYEIYMSAPEKIRKKILSTFNLCQDYIAISPAVIQLIKKAGRDKVYYIPNGIELEKFRFIIPLDSSKRSMIGFPWREESFKGTNSLLQVLEKLQKKYNYQLTIWSFGKAEKLPVPDWLNLYSHPSNHKLETLYNKSMIFITPSQYEGWGLPGSEAMACGAALVSTDNGGIHGYGKHERNCLISPFDNKQALLKNIIRLLEEKTFRIKLAQQGIKDINQFTWNKAANKFENVLKTITKQTTEDF